MPSANHTAAVGVAKQAEKVLYVFYFSIFQKAFFYELFLQATRKRDSAVFMWFVTIWFVAHLPPTFGQPYRSKKVGM
jgi:hypothetical protein